MKNSTKPTPSLLRRAKERFSAWSGMHTGTEALKDMPLTKPHFFSEEWKLYQNNRAREKDFTQMPFDRVLAAWGVKTDEDRRAWIKQKRLETGVGIVLFLFAFTAWCFTAGACTPVSILSSCACLSVCALGILQSLTSLWRMRCLQKRTFKPFVQWVRCFGKF